MLQEGKSVRQAAQRLGVGEATVRGDLEKCSGAPDDAPEHRTGADGKSRPATLPTPEQVAERREQAAELAETGKAFDHFW